MIHLVLHFVVPAIVAAAFFRERWKLVYLVMASTIFVDIDHLLAVPIYDAARCSIGFHPLHGLIPVGFYFLLCIPSASRIIGIGLIIHMALDSIDCQMTSGVWFMLI